MRRVAQNRRANADQPEQCQAVSKDYDFKNKKWVKNL